MAQEFFTSEKPFYVETTRTGRREALHKVHAVCADSSGKILASFGDTKYRSYERSLAKPLQLLTAIRLCPFILDECSNEEIAMMSSSHSGEAKHVELVKGLLERYDLAEPYLLCGAHPPFTPDAIWGIGKKGEKPTPVFCNCSGKHTAMLLACKTQGWPFEGYNQRNHPIQAANFETMGRYTGEEPGKLQYGIDGCSVPTWWLDIHTVAIATARFGDPDFGEDGLEIKIRDRIFEAYHKAAWYTAGTNRFCTHFNAESDGKWLGKIGGEGIFGVCFRDRGIGICLKIVDGNTRAIAPALLHVMKIWDLISEDQLERLKDWVEVPLKNHPGDLVGSIRVVV